MNVNTELNDLEYNPNFNLTEKRNDVLCMNFGKITKRKPFYLTSVRPSSKKMASQYIDRIIHRQFQSAHPE